MRGLTARTRLQVLLVVQAVALLAGLGLWGWNDFVHAERETVAQCEATALLLEQHTRQSIELISNVLAQTVELSAELGPDALRTAPGWRRLHSLATPLPPSAAIFIYGPNGDTLAASGAPVPPAVNVSDRDYFQALRASVGPAEIIIGSALQGRAGHHIFFPIARALRDAEGRFAGVAQIGVETSYIADLLARSPIGASGSLSVYRLTDGRGVIHYPLPAQPLADSAKDTVFWAALTQAAQDAWAGREVSAQGDRLVAARRVGELPLVVVAAVDRDAALAPLWRQELLWIGLILSVAFCLLLLIRLLNRSLAREDASRALLNSAFARVDAATADNNRLLAAATSAEAELQAILDAVPAAIWIARDPQCQTMQGNRVADTFLRISGGANASKSGPDPSHLRFEIVDPTGAPVAADQLPVQRAARGEEVIGCELELHFEDGERRIHYGNAVPLRDAAGSVVGAVAAFVDISERRFAERIAQTRLVEQRAALTALQASEEHLRQAKLDAERASLAKSKFLAAASHDLRQPVQALVLFIGMLKGGVAGTRLEQPTQFMAQAIEALSGMLSGLLDISRLDAGVLLPQITAVDVGDIVQRIGHEYAARAHAKGLRLRVHAGAMPALTDPTFMERVLRNLLENALRYTETGGILVGCRRRGAEIRIDVIDTGLGIPPEHQSAIFEEYFQVGNQARDHAKGLGLGLAIVRRLVGLIGGRIDVRSQLGRGSRFSVFVPAGMAVAAPGDPAVSAALDGVGKLVLVIEDEGMVRASLRMMLESWGFQVVDAADEATALEQLHPLSRRPDLVIADYRLHGGKTGIEAAQHIHDSFAHAIPTVVITGDTAPERIKDVHGSGFLMLHKPVGAEELRVTLAQLLGAD